MRASPGMCSSSLKPSLVDFLLRRHILRIVAWRVGTNPAYTPPQEMRGRGTVWPTRWTPLERRIPHLPASWLAALLAIARHGGRPRGLSIRDFMRHANVSMSERYVHTARGRLRKVAMALDELREGV